MATIGEHVFRPDDGDRLEVRINNTKPVALTDLSMSLLAVSLQFDAFVENEVPFGLASGDLLVRDLRSGSIIFELAAQALPAVPLLWTGGALSEWVEYGKSVLEWLNGKQEKPPKELSKQDLKQWGNILEPVAKDHGSQMNFTVASGGQVINQFYINSEQANAAQNMIRKHIEQRDEPTDAVQQKVVMVWAQTRFDVDGRTGDKAVIEAISRNPVKVIFRNNAVKKAMLSGDPRFYKPWHELAYIVDVRVQTIRGIPKVYTVVDYYPEDTFDPDEDPGTN